MIDAFAVDGHTIDDFHRLSVSKVDALFALGHHHGVLAVRRVIHVVRIVNMHCPAFFACCRIDHGELIAQVLRDPQRFQIPRWNHMLGLE